MVTVLSKVNFLKPLREPRKDSVETNPRHSELANIPALFEPML